jgi:hypothetical protein
MSVMPTVLTVRVIVSALDSRAWQSLGLTLPALLTAVAEPLTIQPLSEQEEADPNPEGEKLLEMMTSASALEAKREPRKGAIASPTTKVAAIASNGRGILTTKLPAHTELTRP